MAKDYSAALERMRKKAKEAAAKNVAPSSLPSPPTDKKDYTEAIARMRRLSERNTHMATVYSDRAKRQQEWVDTRTQDVIRAELEEARKNDGDAALFSGEWFKNIGQEASALVTGKIDAVAADRTKNTEKVAKLEEELARRQAYDYAALTQNKDFDFIRKNYVPKPEFDAFGNPKFNLDVGYMTDEQRDIYNYLKATEGDTAANEYKEYISHEINAARIADYKKGLSEIAEKSPVGASLISVGTGALRGFGYLGQAVDTLSGKDLDPNAGYNIFSHTTSGLRDAVSKNWGPVGSFAYDTGMSMLDFLAAAGMTGGGAAASIILGSGAAADTTIDALERGVPSERAFLMGTAAGVIEAVTEKVSIEKLLENYSEKGIKQFIISNMISEASEEAASEIANTITDVILAEDKSYWIIATNEYKERGYSESEALLRVLRDKLGETGLAALGGAISGGILSGGRVAINAGTNAIQNAGDAAAVRDNAYRGQNTIRKIMKSQSYSDAQKQQRKYTVLPTAVDMEIKAARDRGEVFDIGYEKPYTGVADTNEDIDLQARIDAAETLTEKTGLRHGASEQDIADALEISRALGVEVEFFTQSSKATNTVVDGFYNAENGHIYVNVNAAKGKDAKMTIPIVISHEITHSFEGKEYYGELRDLVAKELKKRGDSIEAAAKRLNRIYEESGRGQSMKANEADVIANFVEKNVLGTKESINKIVGAKPGLGRRILAFLNRILAQFRRGSSAYTTVNQIRDQLDDALSSRAQEAPTAEGVTENVANVANENEDNVQQSKESKTEAGEEVITKKETPATEDSESSQERDTAEEAPAKTKKSPEREKKDVAEKTNKAAEDYLDRIQEKYDAGEITEEEYDRAFSLYEEMQETGMDPSRVSWSVSPTLESDLDAVLNHTFDAKNNEVYIGKTSNFLTEVIGVDSMPVYMPASKAYAAMVPKEEWERTRYYKEQDHYHNLGKEKMIEILNASENPVAAFVATPDLDGNERNNRIVLVTDVKIDGQNAVVIEEIETTARSHGEKLKANKVITTYDRAMIADDIIDAYHESRLLYFDKKRSQHLAGRTGSKPQVAIRDTDFTNNISQFWWNVNKGKLNVTKMQQNKFSVSEVDANDTTEQTQADPYTEIYSTLKTAARSELRHIENVMAEAMMEALGLKDDNSHRVLVVLDNGIQVKRELSSPGYNAYRSEFRKNVVAPITVEYFEKGSIDPARSEEIMRERFNQESGIPRDFAKHMVSKAIIDSFNGLNLIKKSYNEAKTAKEKVVETKNITYEDAKKIYERMKQLKTNTAKIERAHGNFLTDKDKLLVGELLRGEKSPETIMHYADNPSGVKAVYEAKLQTKKANKEWIEFKKQQNALMYDTVAPLAEASKNWKDKDIASYKRLTPFRVFRDVINDPKLYDEYLHTFDKPFKDAKLARENFIKSYQDRVKSLNISTKIKPGDQVSEAYAVQFVGEATENIDIMTSSGGTINFRDGKTLEGWRDQIAAFWENNPGLEKNKTKIESAIKEFRKIYDELITKANEERLKHGIDPIPYRKGYFPHFTGEADGVIAALGRAVGIDTNSDKLPTTINGMTRFFRPNSTWFGHAQQRFGYETKYDAIEGFDNYLEPVANVIFYTETIKKYRTLANAIRYNASDEGIREQLDEIRLDDSIDEAEREARLEEKARTGKYQMSNFVVWLHDYANLLANKKAEADRQMESEIGRWFYNFSRRLEGRVAANMVAGNFSSGTTNFIPLTQSVGRMGLKWTLQGMLETLKSLKVNRHFTGIDGLSSFLAERRGHDRLRKNAIDKLSDISSLYMNLVDSFVSESIVRAAYAKNLKAGMDIEEAMYQADLMAQSIMAGRGHGDMPTVFHSRNFLSKMFTMFQLEPNNQFQEILKDIPYENKERGKFVIFGVYLRYFIGAWIFNKFFEWLFGRKPAIDPIGLAEDLITDISEGDPWNDVVANTVKEAGGQLPFVGGLLFDGGRVPIQSALPDLDKTWKAWTGKDKSWQQRVEGTYDGLSNVIYYLLIPHSGGAVKKAIESIEAAIHGGKYTYTADGKEMSYPVFNDTPWEGIKSGLRGTFMGLTSLPQAQDWIDNDFKTFGAKETAVYDGLKEVGVTGRDAYDLLLDLRGAGKTEEKSINDVKADIIRESDLPGEGKFVAYYGLLANDKERALMNQLNDLGADNGKVTELLMDLGNASKANEKRSILLATELGNDEKRLVYESRISADQSEAIRAFEEAGMDIDSFIEVKNYDDSLAANKELTTSERATEFARWVAKQGFTAEQQEVIQENIRKYSKNTKYDDFTDAGFDDETAYKLTSALADLEPPEGKKQVTDLQKYRAVIDTVPSPVDQMKALEQVMDENAFKLASAAVSYKISPENYIAFHESLSQFDADGNGKYTQAEVETALNSLSGRLSWAEQMTLELTGGSSLIGSIFLSNDQLAVLWQLANTGWSAKNNPYNSNIGQAVLELIGKDKK